MERVCTKCGVTKALDAFPNDKSGKFGKRAQCKPCNALRRKEHYYANQEHEIERSRAYKETHLDHVVERRAEAYKKNRQVEIQRALQWKKANPERVRLHKYNRRQKELAVVSDWGAAKEKRLLQDFDNACALTGDSSCELTLDHFIPLVTGKGGTVAGNMIPLRADLNFSKNSSNPFEWFALNKKRFNLDQQKFDAAVSYLAEMNKMSIAEYKTYVYGCFDAILTEKVRPILETTSA